MLDVSDSQILETYDAILDNPPALDWLLLRYVDDSSKLYVYASGAGGLQEMRGRLEADNDVSFAFCRETVDGQDKALLITYIPQGITNPRRAQVLANSRPVSALLKAHDRHITTQSLADISPLLFIPTTAPSPNNNLYNNSNTTDTSPTLTPSSSMIAMHSHTMTSTSNNNKALPAHPHYQGSDPIRRHQSESSALPSPPSSSSPTKGLFFNILGRKKKLPPEPHHHAGDGADLTPAPPPKSSSRGGHGHGHGRGRSSIDHNAVLLAKRAHTTDRFGGGGGGGGGSGRGSSEGGLDDEDGDLVVIGRRHPSPHRGELPLPSEELRAKWGGQSVSAIISGGSNSRPGLTALATDPEEAARRRVEAQRKREHEERMALREEKERQRRKAAEKEEEMRMFEEEERQRKEELERTLRFVAMERARKEQEAREAEERRVREIEERKRMEKERRLEASRKLQEWREEQERKQEEEKRFQAEQAAAEERRRMEKITKIKHTSHALYDTHMCGWVTIQVEDSSPWKRRWFRFLGSQLMLYRAVQDTQVLDSVDLAGEVKAIREWNQGFEELEAIPHSLAIVWTRTSTRPWFVYCDSAEEKIQFLAFIHKAAGI